MQTNKRKQSLKEKLSSTAWNLWYMKKTNRLAIILLLIGMTAKAIHLIFFKN